MIIKKPMLAVSLMDKNGVIHFEKIKYPVLATPKFDGYRCLKDDDTAMSRNLKPVRNRFVRAEIERLFPDGVDGELIVPGLPFNKTSSVISRFDGEPEFRFCVFDWLVDVNEKYEDRAKRIMSLVGISRCTPVMPWLINSQEELLDYERYCLDSDFEGICFRTPDSPYKFGRSTLDQGWLIKFKRFLDSECIILDFIEQMHNQNELETDLLGHAKRSNAKAGMVPAGTLGSFIVRDIYTNQEFCIGGGKVMDREFRQHVWNNKELYRNKIYKYKFQPTGVKDLPRFPQLEEPRSEDDMS